MIFTGPLEKAVTHSRVDGLFLSLADFKRENKDVLCHIFFDHLIRCSDTRCCLFSKQKKMQRDNFFMKSPVARMNRKVRT